MWIINVPETAGTITNGESIMDTGYTGHKTENEDKQNKTNKQKHNTEN
jgi:hypothetical protein